MNSGDIIFPHLGIHLTNVPQGFSIFGLRIALYGAIIGFGMLMGILAAVCLAKSTKLGKDVIWDFVPYAIILSVIGARIYYIVFAWDYYKNDLLSMFNLRQGGLAIYGGVITALLVSYGYCKIKKLSTAMLLDCCLPGMILGQAIGRWGNFTNREVFGEYTDNLFAMRLPIADVRSRDITEALASHIGAGENFIQVHPTFLYESAWNLLVFVIILLWWKHRRFDGEISLLYLAGYGVGRFIIEGIRTDTLFIPGTTLPVSQVLAAVMVVVSVVIEVLVLAHRKKGKVQSVENVIDNLEKKDS